MQEKKIAFACDHGGVELKEFLKKYALEKGYQVVDFGVSSPDVSVDYPDKAYQLVDSMKKNDTQVGVLICTSGIGMSIAVNRYSFLRGALVFNPEMARLSREHNNANVLVLGQKFVTPENAKACLEIFLTTEFQGGRHERRVEKLTSPLEIEEEGV